MRWSDAMKDRFAAAVQSLGGVDEAKPSDVLDKMKVPGLTRDHVKSYLQKCRKEGKPETPSRTRKGLDDLVSRALDWL
nr:SANT superfamily protein [Oceanusvirus sp.]